MSQNRSRILTAIVTGFGLDPTEPPANGPVPSPSPTFRMEIEILRLYLSALLEHPQHLDLPVIDRRVDITLREPPPASIALGSDMLGTREGQIAMVSMNGLKAVLGDWATQQGWSGELPTKALYSLVAKQALKIDRRTRDPLVYFC